MEPVGDRGPADATLLRFGADRGFPHLAAHASERAAPHHDALADVRRLERRVLGAVGADHLANLQSVLLREGEIALVVTGHRHDRARAVGGEHVVGDPDRNPLPGEYVPRERAGVDTGLLTLRRGTLDIRHVASVLDVSLDLGAAFRRRDLRDERMLRRQHHECGAVDRVRPRREEADLLAGVPFDRERDLGPLGPADPVRL